jgi:hypothetical protein
VFAVYGNDLYENAVGLIGTMSTTPGQSDPEIADNGYEAIVCTGDRLYKKSFSTGGVSRIYFNNGSTYDIPACSVTFIDGYFVAAVNHSADNEDGVYVSALYNGSSWGILDYAKAEFSSDRVIKVAACNGLLYVFGTTSTEIWQNVGDPNYPFQPVQGAKYTFGLHCRNSLVIINGSIYGYFRNQNGEYGIYRINGLQFDIISTPDMSAYLNSQEVIFQTRHCGITYSIGGNNFYQITFRNSGIPVRSFLYNDVSGSWSRTKSGSQTFHIGGRSFSFAGYQYITDNRYATNKVYTLSPDSYRDDQTANTRELIGNHIFLPDRGAFTVRAMSLDMEHGVNTNPMTVYLSLSRDGGHTFGEEYSDTSASSEYTRFFQYNRLGKGRDIVPKIRAQDCKFVLIGAVADIVPYGW